MHRRPRTLPCVSERIPRQWEDVTPEWMTAAIAAAPPRCGGERRHDRDRDDGTNRRAGFGLAYAAGSGPATVFLKAHAPAHRIVHLRNGNLFGEARLFKAGVPLGSTILSCTRRSSTGCISTSSS